MNPEAHAAYKQRFKDYRQKKKVLYQNDPKAKEAARIKKNIKLIWFMKQNESLNANK